MAPSFFPPKHIDGVGTFQDPGALENDPVIWALSEVAALFPLVKKPDFVISLGTGEPGRKNYDVSAGDCRSVWKNGMLRRSLGLVSERMREKPIRRACKTIGLMAGLYHKIHRLTVDFESHEPRLDDAKCIPDLVSKVETDRSLSARIDEVVRCLTAALFHFELDLLPERREGRYMVTGRILCSIRRGEKAFEALFGKLGASAGFLVDGWPLAGSGRDPSRFDGDGNFRMRVEVETSDNFTVSLKQGGGGKAYDISGSPFSVRRLVEAQGLDAPFGRGDHGRRKRPFACGCDVPPAKRRRSGVDG